MLKLISSNLHKISREHGLSEKEIQSQAAKIPDFLQKIAARKQGFYQKIDESITPLNEFCQKAKGKFDSIVVLGIGGSALGTICLRDSLTHLFQNQTTPLEKSANPQGRKNSLENKLNSRKNSAPENSKPRLYVLDNIDPELISEINDVIDYERTLFIVITKSGSTPETLAQYFYFHSRAQEKNLKIRDHFVFITDPHKGLLRQIAREEKIPTFDIPENVGGRFSALTPVGLLPAALIGIDIEQLLAGARQMRELFLNSNFAKNLPFQLAAIQFLLNKKDKTINVLMPYAQKLFRFADWYRQLLAESIGKEKNNQGKIVNVGITPINALGVTDQHSQLQLYNEGPNDKLIIFIEVKNFPHEIAIFGENKNETKISSLKKIETETDFLKNISFNTLLKTEKLGSEQALTSYNRPNITIEIDEINPYALGELLMFFEGATAFLGEFFNVNAFDQPGVELSKQLTKKILLEK